MTTLIEVSSVPGLKRLYYLAIATASFSAFFCALFLLILLYNYHYSLHFYRAHQVESMADPTATVSSDPSYRQPARDPFNLLPTDHQEFLALKNALAADRQNEQLKERIRELDRTLRLDFFKRRALIAGASPLFLLAAIIFLIAARTALVLKRKIPVPEGNLTERIKKEETGKFRLALATVLALSMFFLGIASGLWLLPPPPFEKVLIAKLQQDHTHSSPTVTPPIAQPVAGDPPATAATSPSPEPAPEPLLDREAMLLELEKNWPSFRGFDCTGIGRSDNPPTKWDTKTGENVLWKTEVPLPGKSSPVFWKTEQGGRLFLSGADEKKRQVFCFDTENGQLLWTADAPSTPESTQPVETTEDTGFAAPTMVLDGKRAFALFANGDLVATDFNGTVLWGKSLGIPQSSYGFSASPALFFDRLIVQYDVGDGSEGKSKLYAFDTRTGEILWQTDREMPNSWSSPMVKKIAGRFQVITCADPFVISYDPEDGKELWRCRCLSNDVGPSPAAFGDVVYVSNQGPRTSAIDASGSGDVTESHVLWRGNNALPDTPSPFATAQRVYTLDSYGYLTSYDPARINEKNKRALFWELELDPQAQFYSSPLSVGELVYAFDKTPEDPRAFVVDLSKAKTDDTGALLPEAAEAMILSVNPMAEPCVSSPCILEGKLYIRGEKSIFCVGR